MEALHAKYPDDLEAALLRWPSTWPHSADKTTLSS